PAPGAGPEPGERRGHQHEGPLGPNAKIGGWPVGPPSLVRRDGAIRGGGRTAAPQGPGQPAQRKAERATDQTEPDNADPHHATPAVRLSADATASTCSTRWAKACGVSDWAPSESATSGCAWTSTIRP